MTWKPGVCEEEKPPTALCLRLRVYVNGVPYFVEVEPAWEPHPSTAAPALAAWCILMSVGLAPWLSTPGWPGAPLAPLPGAVPERPISSPAATSHPGDAWGEMP